MRGRFVYAGRGAAMVLAVTLLPARPARVMAQHENHRAATPATLLIAGTVVCADGPALSNAIVQLYHDAGVERHLIASALTDPSGRFAVRAAAGTYTLVISYLGHEPIERVVTIGATQSSLNLGEVQLEIAAVHMDAIAVNAERESVQLRSGATIVETRASTASAGGSIADLLRTVPGVEIDGDGRIMLRGSNSVQVLMNGRRMPLTEAALIAFLKQMPASALERVEAGTSASARQDAEGSAGIVNLVFRNDAQASSVRSIAASIASEDHYSIAGAATGMLHDDLAWDASYSFSGMRPRTESSTSRESFLPADPVRISEQDSRAQAKHRLHSIMLGATSHITQNASFGLRGSYSWMSGLFANHTDFLNTAPDGMVSPRITRSVLEHTIPSSEGSATFEWVVGPLRLSSTARGSFVDEDFDGEFRDGNGNAFLTTIMTSEQNDRVWQNDIGIKAGHTQIELGHKSQLRDIIVRYTPIGEGHDVSHIFTYDDVVHAGYASAHRAFGTVMVQAGVRAEAERNTVNSLQSAFRLRLFPSLLLQWPADASSHLRYRLSYGRRIERPDAESLNPYSMGEDDLNTFVGNPNLRPEVTDQLEFGIERHGTRASWQLTPFLRMAKDPIRPLKAATESGRATTTWQNLARTRAAGADATVRARVNERTTATLSASVYHMQTEGQSYRNDGVYATARANVDVRIAARTNLQLYAYRRGAQAIEQGEILPMTTTELALTRTFGAQDQARVSLRLSDPFESDKVAFRISDDTFVQHSSRRVSRPLASLFLSWSVGSPPRDDAPMREKPPQIF